MTLIAPTLQAFFSDRLAKQLHASPRTIGSYRDTLSLLLRFVQDTTGKAPSALNWDELDEPVIAAFLEHLETERHNSARTRNLRLTAIRSLFSYAAVRHPEHAAAIGRVLSIPPKRFQRRAVTFLTAEESQALIDAPPQDRWEGRRDRAMLTLTIQAGLRVSELVAVNCGDVTLGTGGCVRVEGKGRKHRAVPLTQEAKGSADRLGRRARRHARGPAVPDPHRPPAQPRRHRAPRRHPRRDRDQAMRITQRQTSPPPRPQAQLRDGAAARRRRQHGDRVVARACRCSLDPALYPRRHDDQGTRPRARRARLRQARPLHARRRRAGLPRQPRITMPTVAALSSTRSPPTDPPPAIQAASRHSRDVGPVRARPTSA